MTYTLQLSTLTNAIKNDNINSPKELSPTFGFPFQFSLFLWIFSRDVHHKMPSIHFGCGLCIQMAVEMQIQFESVTATCQMTQIFYTFVLLWIMGHRFPFARNSPLTFPIVISFNGLAKNGTTILLWRSIRYASEKTSLSLYHI